MNYGIGNDEYNFYQTFDNGKTWSILKEGNGDVHNSFERIIIYGKDDDGIKYTDDNFASIENSNITKGSWGALKTENNEIIYSVSLDGDGIYFSNDNGENWKRLSAGTGDKIIVEDDKTIIYGNGDVVEITDKGSIYTPNSTYIPGLKEIISMLAEDVDTGDCLIYILNKIILPSLCTMLMGYEHINDLDNYFNNEKIYNTFYTDGETYKTERVGIDYASDVGMQPLKANYIDKYNQYKSEADDIVLSYTKDDKEIKLLELLEDKSSQLSKTFNIMDIMIGYIKDFVLKATFESIQKKEEYYDNLDDAEDRNTMRNFYEIRKGSEASVVGTIINSIFTFSYSKKMALLKSSIIETAYSMKDSINLKLNILKDKLFFGKESRESVLNNPIIIKMFTFDLKKEWSNSLEKCIKNYYTIASSNINSISKNDDKEYISEAADKYGEIRQSLLNSSYKDLLNLSVDTSILYNISDKIFQNYLSFENNINKAIEDYSLNQDKNNFNILLDKAYEKYCLKSDSLIKESRYQYNNFIIKTGNSFLEKIKKSTNKTISESDAFTPEDYDIYELTYTIEEIDKILKYFNEIISEYRKRCIDLFNIASKEVVDNFLITSNLQNEISNIINDLKTNNNLNYLRNYNLSYYEDKIKESPEIFIKLINTSWYNMRDKI